MNGIVQTLADHPEWRYMFDGTAPPPRHAKPAEPDPDAKPVRQPRKRAPRKAAAEAGDES